MSSLHCQNTNSPSEFEKVQTLTDKLMDALDAAHEHGGLEESSIVKDGDNKLDACEDTLTRLEKQLAELEEARKELKDFTANYKEIVAGSCFVLTAAVVLVPELAVGNAVAICHCALVGGGTGTLCTCAFLSFFLSYVCFNPHISLSMLDLPEINDYKPLTAIKVKLHEHMQALTNAQTDDAEQICGEAKKAIAAVRFVHHSTADRL